MFLPQLKKYIQKEECCYQSIEEWWTTSPNISSDVEIDDSTHILGGYEKVYYSHNDEAFWGQIMVWKNKKTGLGFHGI